MAQSDPAELNGMEVRHFANLQDWSARTDVKQKRLVSPVHHTSREVEISTGGPHQGGYPIPEGASGWNAGDIDFRWDGAIFIRNPYLADAIERHLKAAYDRSVTTGDPKFLKIIRDEGWSGTQTNIIC